MKKMWKTSFLFFTKVFPEFSVSRSGSYYKTLNSEISRFHTIYDWYGSMFFYLNSTCTHISSGTIWLNHYRVCIWCFIHLEFCWVKLCNCVIIVCTTVQQIRHRLNTFGKTFNRSISINFFKVCNLFSSFQLNGWERLIITLLRLCCIIYAKYSCCHNPVHIWSEIDNRFKVLAVKCCQAS